MKNKRLLCWLIALGMTAVLFASVALCFDVHFAVNDDSTILRSTLGYETGTPATFLLFLHGILTWPLHWLGTAFPGVVWYSWMQMALLFLATTVCVKSILLCFVKHSKPLWLGTVFSALFMLAFCLNNIVSMTFSITSALLGAAAVLQLMSIDFDRPGAMHIIIGVIGAAALAVLGYAMRLETLPAIVAMCGLAFVYQWLTHKPKARHMVICMVIVALMLGGAVGMRMWETASVADEYADFLRWQDARLYPMDYFDLGNITDEELAMVGWDRLTANLLNEWFLLDSSVTTESFEILTDYIKANDTRTLGGTLLSSWESLTGLIERNPNQSALLGLGLLTALSVLIASAIRRKGRLALAALASLALVAAMFVYLMLRGRMPMHALYTPVLPMTAFALALLPACIPSVAASSALAAALAALTALNAVPLLAPMLHNEEADLALTNVMTDLEEYAIDDPDCLYLYDFTISMADNRAFPDYSNGVPHNISFWGGWSMRSPENVAQFERFDIDPIQFDPEIFLRGDVYLVSGRVDPPPTLLIDWLSDRLGAQVECELYSEYGSVYIFQFCIY